MSKRPLIRTTPVSEFGEFEASAFDGDVAGQEADAVFLRDMTYVPGWSGMRRGRDEELAELAQGRRTAKEVRALPVNVRLVRRASAKGEFDGKKLMMAGVQGYKPITSDMRGKVDWFTAMPPGARILENGEIVNAAGDMVYMYTEAPQAARNLARKAEKTRLLADQAGEKVAGGVVEAGGEWAREPLD